MRYLICILILLAFGVGCDGEDTIQTNVPVDHTYSDYEKLLSQFVSEGLVDYAGLKADRNLLDRLVKDLEGADLDSADENQSLAFYINAYNLITLRSIVDAYPVKSIQDIDGVWDEKKWIIAGQKTALNQIEHELIRPVFNDPRVHFALVCAAIGCPHLIPRPYLPDSLDLQLDRAGSAYVLAAEYNRLHAADKTAELSKIFEWYGEDFVDRFHDASIFPELSVSQNAALNYIISRYPPDEQEDLRETDFNRIIFREYDWSLNEMK